MPVLNWQRLLLSHQLFKNDQTKINKHPQNNRTWKCWQRKIPEGLPWSLCYSHAQRWELVSVTVKQINKAGMCMQYTYLTSNHDSVTFAPPTPPITETSFRSQDQIHIIIHNILIHILLHNKPTPHHQVNFLCVCIWPIEIKIMTLPTGDCYC